MDNEKNSRWDKKMGYSGRLWVRLMFFVVVCCGFIRPAFAAGDIRLDYIGQQVFATGERFADTEVGGLSGIDYLGRDNIFVAISDDRSQINPARFYTLSLDLDRQEFRSVKFQSVEFMKQPGGTLFPKPGVMAPSKLDPESIRLSPQGRSFFWISEGNAKAHIDPFVREMSFKGDHMRSFEIPEKFRVRVDMKTGKNVGIRNNLSFESLSVSSDGKTIMVAPEVALYQDGPRPTAKKGSLIRFLELDVKSAKPRREFVYESAPVKHAIGPEGGFSINGLVDIFAIGPKQYISVERSFTMGKGNSIRLFLVDLRGASDVSDLHSLAGKSYKKVKKTLLLDMDSLNLKPDNIEGLALGQKFADGSRSLILISDNNFSENQETQILAFAIYGLED